MLALSPLIQATGQGVLNKCPNLVAQCLNTGDMQRETFYNPLQTLSHFPSLHFNFVCSFAARSKWRSSFLWFHKHLTGQTLKSALVGSFAVSADFKNRVSPPWSDPLALTSQQRRPPHPTRSLACQLKSHYISSKGELLAADKGRRLSLL